MTQGTPEVTLSAMNGKEAGAVMRLASRTDVGRKRARNEDSALAIQWQTHGDQDTGELGLLCLADGMGGHSNGHIASQMAVRTFAAAMTQCFAQAPLQGVQALPHETLCLRMQEAIDQAAQRILEARNFGLDDMGTTLCAALVTDNSALIANVGDSRAYLVTEASIQQITEDHSLVQQLIARGELTPDAAATHPDRHVIYRMLGLHSTHEADFFSIDLAPGDTVLLCSDGLSGMLSDEAIHATFAPHKPLPDILDSLIEQANAHGGEDNITAVAIRLETA